MQVAGTIGMLLGFTFPGMLQVLLETARVRVWVIVRVRVWARIWIPTKRWRRVEFELDIDRQPVVEG